MLHSGEGSEYVFEDRPTVGMIQGVRLRCLMTEIRNLQDSQDCGILPDTAVMNLTSQPLPDRFTPSPGKRPSHGVLRQGRLQLAQATATGTALLPRRQ